MGRFGHDDSSSAARNAATESQKAVPMPVNSIQSWKPDEVVRWETRANRGPRPFDTRVSRDESAAGARVETKGIVGPDRMQAVSG